MQLLRKTVDSILELRETFKFLNEFFSETFGVFEIIQIGVLYLIIGLIIAYFLCETGSRSLHGNFTWQNVMCSFLLFLLCIVKLLKLIAANPIRWKGYRLEISIFALHFLSGIFIFFQSFSNSIVFLNKMILFYKPYFIGIEYQNFIKFID